MKCRFRCWLLLVATGTLVYRGTAAEARPRRAVLLVIDRVTLADLGTRATPNLNALIRSGGLAVMTERGEHGPSSGQTTLSISSGAAATVPKLSDQTAGFVVAATEVCREESATGQTVYRRRSGQEAPAEALIHVSLYALQQLNLTLPRPPTLGALGSALHAAGLRTAAFGSSDLSLRTLTSARYRYAAAIAADERGLIDGGEIGKSLLVADASAPFGVRTNAEALAGKVAEGLRSFDLLVVDFGDTYRADAYAALASAGQASRLKRQALERADQFAGRVAGQLNFSQDLLFVLPLSLPLTAEYRLAPLIVRGAGIRGGSLLLSPTTRREGIVSPVDLAPTILTFFGLHGERRFVGRALVSRTAAAPARYVSHIVDRAALVDGQLRPWTLTLFGLFETLVLVLAAWALVRDGTLQGMADWGLLFLMTVPLALCAVNPWVLDLETVPRALTLTIALASAATWAIRRFFRERANHVRLIVCATALVIAVDVCTGARLAFNSVLGYSPFIGARYYGLGNELMAALTASVLLCVGLSPLGRPAARNRIGSGLLFGAALIVVGAPPLGANVGGTLTAAFAFALCWLQLGGRTVRRRELAAGAVIALAFVVAYLFLDLSRGEEASSHFGRFVKSAGAGGTQALAGTLIVKAEVLGKSFRHYYWVLATVAAIAAVWALCARHRQAISALTTDHPGLEAAWRAAVAAGIVGPAINDSGVVISALIALYVLGGVLYLLPQRVEEKISPFGGKGAGKGEENL